MPSHSQQAPTITSRIDAISFRSPTGPSALASPRPSPDIRNFVHLHAEELLPLPNAALDAALWVRAHRHLTGGQLRQDIVVSVFNAAGVAVAANLHCSLIRAGIKEFLGIALDRGAMELCTNYSMTCVLALDQLQSSSSIFHYHGDANFKYLSKLKSRNVLEVILRRYDVLLLDVDIVVLKNPLPLLREESQLWDLQVQSDSPYGGQKESYANSGMYYLRSNDNTINLFFTLWQAGINLVHLSEQNVLAAIMGVFATEQRKYLEQEHRNATEGLKFKHLEPRDFPNGAHYFISNGTNNYDIRNDAPKDPYLIHFNWIYGHLKALTMKRCGFWYLDAAGQCANVPLETD